MKKGLTRRKLQEAKFFLGLLKPNYTKEQKFDFFLSAFVSAARSVTWVMRSEYSDTPGWSEWHRTRQLDSAEEQLFKGTTIVRNRTQKLGALKTLMGATVAGVYLANGDEVAANNIFKQAAQDGLPAKIGGSSGKYTIELMIEGRPVVLYAREVQFDRRLEEFPGKHILDVCKRYYESLAKLVNECEARFCV